MNNASYNDHIFPINSLNKADITLIEAAIGALAYAYAPYSNFLVGAAVRLDNGQIVTGANQENASYPLCMCGERVALYAASMNGSKSDIDALAIVARNMSKRIEKPVPPCGACRQVIQEYEMRQSSGIKILLKGESDDVLVFDNISSLLPFSFDFSYLLPS
ncbi:MAG: cytidine deaminase [Saprospiraceae bacterium]|nr:cytidine deaminase [Saprospiraceae bacterium]